MFCLATQQPSTVIFFSFVFVLVLVCKHGICGCTENHVCPQSTIPVPIVVPVEGLGYNTANTRERMSSKQKSVHIFSACLERLLADSL